MIWLPFILLALAVFLIAALALRLPRSGYTLFGAALLFGLAGYALQGSPGEPSAPAFLQAREAGNGALFVNARRDFFDPNRLPSRYVVSSDAFARQGKFADSANFARLAVEDDPRDVEAWVALGNALVEQAEGQLTPAALFAYVKAEQLDPQAPAARYFVGLAMLRAGKPFETRRIWEEILASAPADATWRPLLAARLARLDALLRQGSGSGH